MAFSWRILQLARSRERSAAAQVEISCGCHQLPSAQHAGTSLYAVERVYVSQSNPTRNLMKPLTSQIIMKFKEKQGFNIKLKMTVKPLDPWP